MAEMTETELQVGQEKRLESARKALAEDLWNFTRTPGGWRVQTTSNEYDLGISEGGWICICPDNIRYRHYGLDCKHIHGLRLWLEQAGEASQETEQLSVQGFDQNVNPLERMNTSWQTNSGSQSVLDRLKQPLDMSRVKRRPAPGQGTVPYLEGFDVIETANLIFDFGWSFDLLSEPKIMRWDRVVTFYDHHLRKKVPVLDEDGNPVTELTGMVYVTGRISVEIEGKTYTHADTGRCTFTGDTPEALDTAIAGSVTDCLKRCFRQLGDQFGNRLYDKETARAAVSPTAPNLEAGLQGNGQPDGSRLTGNGSKNGKSKKPPAKTKTAADANPSSPSAGIQDAGEVICPFGTKRNPQLKGMKLGEIASLPIGLKVLSFLANQWLATDDEGIRAKEAARILLARLNT